MKNTIENLRLRVGLLAATAALATFEASAQTNFSTDFSSGNDNEFDRYDPVAQAGAGSHGSWTVDASGYRIQAASTSPFESLVGPARAGSIVTGFNADDFRLTFDLKTYDNSLPQFVGALARATQVGPGTTQGYVLGYDNSRGGGIFISKIVGEAVAGVVASTDINTPLPLDPNKSYHFDFSLIGSSFTGAVYDTADLATPIAGIAGSDSSFATGAVGLLVADNSSTADFSADATFANFSVTSVPEPGHLALLGAGMMLATGLLRRARR